MIYKEKFNEWLNSAVVAEEVKEEASVEAQLNCEQGDFSLNSLMTY